MIQDNIQFTIVQPRFTQILNETNGGGKISMNEEDDLNAGTVNNIINAVSIDWNNAQLPNSSNNGGNLEIQRTGQLLNLINEMKKELQTLTAAIVYLSTHNN